MIPGSVFCTLAVAGAGEFPGYGLQRFVWKLGTISRKGNSEPGVWAHISSFQFPTV